VLIGRTVEEVLERNRERPRWGMTKELKQRDAGAFFHGERPRYKAEAEKFGYPVFENADDAYQSALSLLQFTSAGTDTAISPLASR
jgi:hypothetical protein